MNGRSKTRDLKVTLLQGLERPSARGTQASTGELSVIGARIRISITKNLFFDFRSVQTRGAGTSMRGKRNERGEHRLTYLGKEGCKVALSKGAGRLQHEGSGAARNGTTIHPKI